MQIKNRLAQLLAFSAVFFGAAGADAEGHDGPAVKIGAILPLSGDGSFWGINPKHGIELALKDAAAASKPAVQVVFEDDHCDAAKAVAAYRKLIDVDKVRIILGPACSSATLAVAPLAQKEGILMFCFSEADSISRIGENIFRMWVPNGKQGRRLARYVFEKDKISRIAIISIQNAFGTDIAGAFKEEYLRLGGIVAAEEEYGPDAREFKTELFKIKSVRPAALFFASYIADGAIILRDAKQLNLASRYYSGSTINSPDFFKQLGAASDGLVFADIEDQTSAEFRKRFSAEFKSDWPGMQSGAPLFYDIINVLLAQPDLKDTAAVRTAVRGLRDYRGVSGPFTFDGSGDLERSHSIFRAAGQIISKAE